MRYLLLLLTATICSTTITAAENHTVTIHPNYVEDPYGLLETIQAIPSDEWIKANIKESYKVTGKLDSDSKGVRNPSCDLYVGEKAQQFAPLFERFIDRAADPKEVVQVFFGRYRHGHYMHVHNDDAISKIGDKVYRRKQAFILYLTENWTESDGGHLIYYPNNKITEKGVRVLPSFNNLATFTVGLEHEVAEVTAPEGKDRWSVYGWVMREESSMEKFQRTPFYQFLLSSPIRRAVFCTVSCGVLVLLRLLGSGERKREAQRKAEVQTHQTDKKQL